MTTDELRAKFENWWTLEIGSLDFRFGWSNAWLAYQAAHASRDAEVEALRKDAKRMAWLRSRCDDDLYVRKGLGQITGAALDEAIDAAMREESK